MLLKNNYICLTFVLLFSFQLLFAYRVNPGKPIIQKKPKALANQQVVFHRIIEEALKQRPPTKRPSKIRQPYKEKSLKINTNKRTLNQISQAISMIFGR